jgi:putative membrane protein
MMLWFKALHLIFMVTWFAGLFYLPRLYVYHAMSDDQASIDRFKIMERKLYFGIMTPGMALTLVFGIGLLFYNNYLDQLWIQIKLGLIAVLVIYHIHCGKLLLDFKHDRNRRSHVYFRWYNEFPVIFLIAIIFLAVLRPV